MPLLGVLTDTREAFHELGVRTGQQVLLAMMEADREALCGPKGRHQRGRRSWRGANTSSRVTLGRQVELPRLRVRSPRGEVALASFQRASSTDAMDAHAMEAVASGVSTRNCPRTLDPIPDAMSGQRILEDLVPLGEHQVGGYRDAAPLVSFGEPGEQHLHLAALVLREDGDHASGNTVRRTLEGQQRITATFRGADERNSHGTTTLGSCLPPAIRAGPRREFQSPMRGRGLRRATSVQTPITVRAKLAFGRHAPLRERPLCPKQTPCTRYPRAHAAACCSLRVRAPAPPGWKLRRATRAEPPQPAIYDALGIDPAPGATRETIV